MSVLALLKADTQSKIETWLKNLNARNAGAKKEPKAASTIKAAIFVQKYNCNYTVGQRGYPEHVRRKAIQLYLEGNGLEGSKEYLKLAMFLS